MNWIVILGAAVVPMIIGFIWYNPKVFGKAWMDAAEMTEDKMKGANMGLVFGLSFLFSIFLAIAMHPLVIHQLHVMSALLNEQGMATQTGPVWEYYQDFMANYGDNFRTFKHGAFHGTIYGFMIALPIIGTNALFERKGFKYIAVNTGYWIVSFALMGGVICQWG